MQNTSAEEESEPLPTGVFKLPGEPTIVINGVPDVSSNDIAISVESQSPALSIPPGQTVSRGNAGFGVWMEGREVRKLFENKYYSGTVTHFDKETEWYRVEYEDGDSEDLDWDELLEVLLPLDIKIPLKALAQKTAMKRQKTMQKSKKDAIKSSGGISKRSLNRVKRMKASEESSVAK